jgi:GNAT superfamily N-acetyltransferase
MHNKQPELLVERASLKDLDATHTLFMRYLAFYEREVDPDEARAFLHDRIGNGQSVIFVAWLNGQAVGFTQLYPTFASLSLKRSWILNDLYVAESARGRGVAMVLMAAAKQLAVDTGACEIFLQTARSNKTAQALYEKLNYVRDDAFLVYTLDVVPTD